MRIPRLAVVVSIVLAIGAALYSLGPSVVSQMAYAKEAGKAKAAREQLQGVASLSASFKQVAKAIRPSVVNITSIQRVKAPRQVAPFGGPGFGNDPFREFFGRDPFGHFFQRPGPPRPFEQKGTGTGVIVSKDGYVLTNNHVVRNADEVTVKLSSGKTFKAKIVGTDPKSDLAVLKIDRNGLVPATLGDSTRMEVGDWVLAVGNPFGLEQSVTAGIVSAKGRANVGITEYEDFIQTDAAINPGNSGGPLLNLKGEVIGINTAIATRSGGYQGIGFSIPSSMAKAIMDSLIKTGRVERGWLGVAIQNLDDELAASFGLPGGKGVLVSDVLEGSPAQKAGLKEGDIILTFDGTDVATATGLRKVVAATAPDKEVALEIFRAGKKQTVKLKLGRLQSQPTLARAGGGSDPLGVTVETLTAKQAKALGLAKARGVVVQSVKPGSLAARVGLRTGDLILSIDGKEITDADDFASAIKKYGPAKGLRMRVRTRGMTRYLFIKNR